MDKETNCINAFGAPNEKAVLQRNWISAQRSLLQCRATLKWLSFKDAQITKTLESIQQTLESMGVKS